MLVIFYKKVKEIYEIIRKYDKISKNAKEYQMELVDIVDENNRLTGQIEDRWVAYNKGLWRRTVFAG